MGEQTPWGFVDTNTALFSFWEDRWVEDLIIPSGNIIDQQVPMFEGKIRHHTSTHGSSGVTTDGAVEDFWSNLYACYRTDSGEDSVDTLDG